MNGHDAVNGGRRGRVPALVAAVAAVVGVLVLVMAVTSQDPAPPRLDGAVGSIEPTDPPTAQSDARSDAQSDSGAKTGAEAGPVVQPAKEVPLGPSQPVSISIPAIDVRSEVFPIGKAPDGTLAVPQPGPDLDKAAWFENSPTPGQPGPAVIEGHVSTEQRGPSIFFDLAELRPGDRIRVEREDGKIAIFEVDALREFAKDTFPTELVYGGNLDEPQLRLITCSDFDPTVGEHTGNLIVFSHLTRVIPS